MFGLIISEVLVSGPMLNRIFWEKKQLPEVEQLIGTKIPLRNKEII